MYQSKLILLLFLCLGSILGDLTVDQYDEIINKFIEKTKTYEYPTDSRSFVQGTVNTSTCLNGGYFDIILVGAGSTGTVLANRLSEVSQLKILLLEAGGEENEFTDIPAMFDYLRLSNFNWGYKSVPQTKSLFGYVDRTEVIPRGKVLGGSSTINALMYVRGNSLDYDMWASIDMPSWSYSNVLPYFKKSETASISLQDFNYHGHNGPWHVQDIDVISPLSTAFLQANQELGRKILDYNGKDQMGFSRLQMTTVNGRRDSGAKAFLKPARGRSNLVVRTNALVMKVLMEGNVATGVQYISGGKVYNAYAREIVLSAGGINTPQLLMLSGIGPKEHLKEKGVKLVKDLPVGENLWDHICFALLPFTTNLTMKDKTQKELIIEYLTGKGPFTTPDSIQDIGFESLFWSNKDLPDIEHIFRTAKTPIMPYDYYRKTKNFDKDIYNYVIKPIEGKVTWTSYAVLLHPKSRGNIKLKTNSPFDFPLINPNYFSDPQNSDVNTFVAAIKDMVKISKTKAMQQYKSEILKINLPGCMQYTPGSDDYYACLVKYMASTLHHFAGACKMGPSYDPTSVVGPDLKVHGVQNLRVADCSVIPVTTSGHTNAVAFMIGEKAADIIKNYWFP